ncbi:hypothetical protein K503DRAFT_774456, partial [Rhizopogon vinicolor AM-OR11-026]
MQVQENLIQRNAHNFSVSVYGPTQMRSSLFGCSGRTRECTPDKRSATIPQCVYVGSLC